MAEPLQDEFKWFGEGFDGFPRHIAQDCVIYTIRIIDTQLTDSQTRDALNRIEKAAAHLCKTLLNDYIWQRQPFTLKLQREDKIWILHGQTNFGDAIADEWLVVYLLRTLSKDFSDAWIRVHDSDGEFLLVEAADALPGWLTPEVGCNRVWIHNGQLNIIPLHQQLVENAKTKPLKRPLTMQEATAFIRTMPSKLLRPTSIQEEAFYRIRNYPSRIADSLHTSPIRIPRRLAYVLNRKPEVVSLAIEAFYLRDPIALRPIDGNDSSILIFAPFDLVETSIRFNKVGYAQLYSQEFPIPRMWAASVTTGADEKVIKRSEIGMKLTCGFEMMVSDKNNQDKREVREIQLMLEDIDSGNEALPDDDVIKTWPRIEDDDSWLDIDYEELDSVLAKDESKEGRPVGFGTSATMEEVRKMAERFEDFLNDDGIDDMDEDDDEEDSNDAEDDDISFNEEEFAKLMREMMGMPSDRDDGVIENKSELSNALQQLAQIEAPAKTNAEASNNEAEVREMSKRIEAELDATGALNLDPTPRKLKAAKVGPSIARNANSGRKEIVEESDESEDEGDVDIDIDLARNLLQSLQRQAGMSGPVGNMMEMMGSEKPRRR